MDNHTPHQYGTITGSWKEVHPENTPFSTTVRGRGRGTGELEYIRKEDRASGKRDGPTRGRRGRGSRKDGKNDCNPHHYPFGSSGAVSRRYRDTVDFGTGKEGQSRLSVEDRRNGGWGPTESSFPGGAGPSRPVYLRSEASLLVPLVAPHPSRPKNLTVVLDSPSCVDSVPLWHGRTPFHGGYKVKSSPHCRVPELCVCV